MSLPNTYRNMRNGERNPLVKPYLLLKAEANLIYHF